MFHTIEQAIEDLKMGRPIIVVDDEDRENEGDFVVLADKMTAETMNFLITEGKGLVCAALAEEVAVRLDLSPMVDNSTDPHGTAFTVSVDHVDSTTGISASERAHTVRELANANARPADFQRPGHIFPLIAKKGGVSVRRGHTEASVDLARLSGSEPVAVICEIIREDGEMARVPDLVHVAERHDLKFITIEELVRYMETDLVEREADVNLPSAKGEFRLIGYRNVLDREEHVALIKGELEHAPLVRIHSECLTGDVFGSYRCDCGPQLDASLAKIEEEGGVVLYMRQEGRGIGLLNKLKAYELQEQGLDTVEANVALGLHTDLRDYRVSAGMLRDLGVTNVRLMTNNPEKVDALEACGITVVERVPIIVGEHAENERYRLTKQQKMNHFGGEE
ncbi:MULTISPECIES: bifunctional 3,4-dihydroxy-2-butanone-4-phosphate synthase/GTP cyclohydrolase II [unclassified Exiguobacterium]|uniref:bifunctional 3,4-dihydroxy-2-butanone-4-phosphate synthase/GTP cyclohydrolase II n=1 Tax=unclassified Exiguobacterium TaxID=2644629 RepID=UPI00103AD420|nr:MULTISPECIES: bifunctional 3,4-dihydroxy-2-butanone-4-phosphate synthase/GTP cyclohydrolase II [unclassified Exiguobacterium]TCI48112.1 bifunctional 3,4-dihydroxy-2-butanone-4-phosphate synthase/GTP cyclohydrolase II [Exiguobacterium sp. SH5S32]TCI54997.1 bifunctional 3,4-dihydroxy-2-butanone-4-phosphate synthase/GTP cyclohydrolase II [Exiguobacterium sp. SH1S4]TCI74791.1 bifunctional 3,4-dihydroxy-2-butanone-4-phosphate synthase/GTP cyclohydrolase II [Exiguobacterium sp. SH1S1]TCI77736.1 bi